MFDNLDQRKYYFEIDGQRYPRESILKNYGESDYFEQYKDLKMFSRIHRRTNIKSSYIISGHENKKPCWNIRFTTST